MLWFVLAVFADLTTSSHPCHYLTFPGPLFQTFSDRQFGSPIGVCHSEDPSVKALQAMSYKYIYAPSATIAKLATVSTYTPCPYHDLLAYITIYLPTSRFTTHLQPYTPCWIYFIALSMDAAMLQNPTSKTLGLASFNTPYASGR